MEHSTAQMMIYQKIVFLFYLIKCEKHSNKKNHNSDKFHWEELAIFLNYSFPILIAQ